MGCYFGCQGGNKCAWIFWILFFFGGCGLLVAGGVEGYLSKCDDSAGTCTTQGLVDKNVWEALLRCRDDGRSPSGCYYWARDDLSGAYPSMLRDIILLIVGAGCIVPLSLFPCFFFCCCASRKYNA